MDSPVTSTGPAQPRSPAWPIRTGAVPPLAGGFITRPETVPGLAAALAPGAVVVLADGQAGSGQLGSCGKTQLALYSAESLRRCGQVDLLAWVDASGPAGRVLITTPGEDAVAGQPQAQVVAVGAFSTREAMNYLMGLLADDPEQRNGAIDLALMLSGDPCALTHAGAVITTTTQTCRDYQRRYADRRALLASRQAGSQPPAARAVTWTLSAERAGQLSPLEIWPQQEPHPWLAAGLRSCVASLQQTADDRLWEADSCHPLLIKAGRSLDAARLTGPAVSYWTQLAAASDKILGPDSPGTLTAGACLAQALLTAGQAPEAAAWWQWAAAGRARMSGPDHPDTIAARVKLGRALVAASQPSDSVTVLGEAVADYERVRGPGHRDTLSARDELAAACHAAGQPAEAIGHYQRTLADRERAQGPRHPETITARARLGGACLAGGRLKEAIAWYKKALADRQRVLGAGHLDTITAQRSLAAACYTAGKIATALQLHEQACAGYEQVLGADHPDTLAARADLANAYLAAGRLADAATLLRDTLARCEQTLPPGDPLTHALRQSMTGLAGK